MSVPLDLNYSALGVHQYTMGVVTDGLGNVITIDQTVAVRVLPRMAFNFKDCKEGRDVPLLIGQKAISELRIAAVDGDIDDGPWTVSLMNEASGKEDIVTIPRDQREVAYHVQSPGVYQIFRAEGRICSGVILSPDTCRVVEVPQPHVDVSWSRIHEWSVCCVFHPIEF